MPRKRVLLKRLTIHNLGPIKDDDIEIDPFTYFVGRNNAGKTHYLKAVELLLATRSPSAEEIFKLQNDKAEPIVIKGVFEGIADYTSQITKSNHKEAIEKGIVGDELTVARTLQSQDPDSNQFGIMLPPSEEIINPTGFGACQRV